MRLSVACVLLLAFGGMAAASPASVTEQGASSMPDEVLMPDGSPFVFWDDVTDYSRVYHVACEHPDASDENPGTEESPFATIGRAAAVLQPGEKVVVHAGVYRECVRPPRGGEGPDRMIAYEAAPGEEVVVKGSAAWQPEFRPSEGWRTGRWRETGAAVWMGDLPAELFVGYNPFIASNMPPNFRTFVQDWTADQAHRFQLKRGHVFVDGEPLQQVFWPYDLREQDGAFWVEEPGLRLHLRMPGDADPSSGTIEVSVHEQVFAPAERHLGYIRVSGFRFEHAADAIPVPQRAAVSTSRGDHWIIEDNEILHANALGLDIGNESWSASRSELAGYHIVRRNRIADCGIGGIQGVYGVVASVIEDNVIEAIGRRLPERLYECAGLKFHYAEGTLIRRNVFRNIRDASGIWLDCANKNCRVTGNVFTDISTGKAAVYFEVNHDLNLIDGNVFWDVRNAPGNMDRREDEEPIGGFGVYGDSGENLIVAHNFFGRVQDNYAIDFAVDQDGRIFHGRVGLGRRHQALNNMIDECRKRVLFQRVEENASDGNLFDWRGDGTSFCVAVPAPEVILNLAAWQEYYGFDVNSTQGGIEAEFDPETLELSCRFEGELPARQPVEAMHGAEAGMGPGPFTADQWRETPSGGEGTRRFGPAAEAP
jgi:hypothetical protein